MGSFMGGAAGRRRWLALFTILLLSSTSVPVLAESLPDPPEDVPLVSKAEADKLPSATDVAKGLDEAERLEAEEEELRETPQAEREREESRLAYTDISTGKQRR